MSDLPESSRRSFSTVKQCLLVAAILLLVFGPALAAMLARMLGM